MHGETLKPMQASHGRTTREATQRTCRQTQTHMLVLDRRLRAALIYSVGDCLEGGGRYRERVRGL